VSREEREERRRQEEAIVNAAAFRVVSKADGLLRGMELVERGVYRIDPASVLALRSALVDLKVKANRR
jgi:hypothetical protein